MNEHQRRLSGDETYHRLLNWTGQQKPSERLASTLLANDGYESVDPSHPLGGPDSTMDAKMTKESIEYIGAAYFPKGQQDFKEIYDKFKDDFKGVKKNKASGFVFVTNQHITVGERNKLEGFDSISIEIYHLERLVTLLNLPRNYGIRYEYLNINLTGAEKISYLEALELDMNHGDIPLLNFIDENACAKLISTRTELSFYLREFRLWNALMLGMDKPKKESLTTEQLSEFYRFQKLSNIFKLNPFTSGPHTKMVFESYFDNLNKLVEAMERSLQDIDFQNFPDIHDIIRPFIAHNKNKELVDGIKERLELEHGATKLIAYKYDQQRIAAFKGTAEDLTPSDDLELYRQLNSHFVFNFTALLMLKSAFKKHLEDVQPRTRKKRIKY